MPTSRTSPAGGAPVGTSWGRPGNRFVPRTRKPLGVPLNPAVAASDVTNEIDSAARARLTPTLRSRGYAPRAIDNESKDLSRSLQVLPILMRPAHRGRRAAQNRTREHLFMNLVAVWIHIQNRLRRDDRGASLVEYVLLV